MGRRGTPHQPDNGKGELVPFDPTRKTLGGALLPYEKELIRILGCTEEEYRRHVVAVQLKSKQRPAEYELVPDVQERRNNYRQCLAGHWPGIDSRIAAVKTKACFCTRRSEARARTSGWPAARAPSASVPPAALTPSPTSRTTPSRSRSSLPAAKTTSAVCWPQFGVEPLLSATATSKASS